jgi:hypothetical protein
MRPSISDQLLKQRAVVLGERIRAENRVDRAVQIIQRYLGVSH